MLKINWQIDCYNRSFITLINRPHKSHGGLTPYEVYRAKMNIDIQGQS